MKNWKLYWVECPSPDENCFVVARSSRSAAKYEEDYSGFDPRDCTAELVMTVPGVISGLQLPPKTRTKMKNPVPSETEAWKQEWPGYAREWLLEMLGASVKMREDAEVTIINGKAYRTAGLMRSSFG